MPSPFPGMDPFLEEPTEWSGVHAWLITAIGEDLGNQIAPDYRVKIEERVFITAPDDLTKQLMAPNVFLVTGRKGRSPEKTAAGINTPVLVEPLYEEVIRDRYLEIHDTRTRQVVTTIEVLSPINKASGSPGREAYLRKRQAVMSSTTHWIEIDLLRAGERPPEIAGKSDYYALLKRAVAGTPFEVWFIDLRDRLPTIAVPLRPPHPDVPLDLQAAFERVYARGHYAEDTNYSGRVPPPPLPPADVAWVQGRVQAWLAARQEPDRQ